MPADAYYSEAVRRLAADGVFEGTECDEGFCPADAIDRATMAVWTVRVVDEADPAPVSSTRFADVDATHAHAAFMERLAALGVTQGCGDGTNFCPDSAVTRAEMAVFLSRAFDLAEGPDPGFGDVPADAWYATDVAKLAASGITTGCGDGTNFCPDQDTTRAQMASFLARALGLIELPASVRFAALDTGHVHSCALRTDSTVVCWGDNAFGQADAPDGAFEAVSAGGTWDRSHSCGVRVDATVVCWGSNNVKQSDAPGGEFVMVSAGGYHSCGVRVDATVACWGWNLYGQSDAPGGEFVTVSAGSRYSCGVRVDATVVLLGFEPWRRDGRSWWGVRDGLGWQRLFVRCARRRDGRLLGRRHRADGGSWWGVRDGFGRWLPFVRSASRWKGRLLAPLPLAAGCSRREVRDGLRRARSFVRSSGRRNGGLLGRPLRLRLAG